MANTFKFGNKKWATKEDSILAYNDENNNFKPLPFDFSRSSSATVVNEQGLIETVGGNVPRVDYLNDTDGALLLEPSRSNDLQRSQEFDNTYWTKYQSSVSANSYISPDGTLNADKLIEDNSNSMHQVGRAISYNSGTTYTVSVFAKSSDRNLEIAAGNTNTFPAKVIFDLSNGTVLSSTLGNASIESFNNGWYRCIVTATALVTATTNLNFGLANGSTLSYSGDGVSFIELFGGMREQGSYATSYIPTSGSSVTRIAENCNGAGNSSVFNDSEGVFFVEIQALEEGSSASRRITLSDESTNNRLLIETDESTGTFKFFIAGGGTVRAIATSTGNTQTDINKLAIGYDGVNAKAYINGTQVGSITDATTRTGMDTVDIADWNGTSQVYYGRVKQVIVFNEALSDSELKALTT